MITKVDVEAAIAEVHVRATALYLQRQEFEAARQQLQQQATQCDLALVSTDGEIAALQRLIEQAT